MAAAAAAAAGEAATVSFYELGLTALSLRPLFLLAICEIAVGVFEADFAGRDVPLATKLSVSFDEEERCTTELLHVHLCFFVYVLISVFCWRYEAMLSFEAYSSRRLYLISTCRRC